MATRRLLVRACQGAFWVLVVFCSAMALVPAPPSGIAGISDYALHASAFCALAGVARLGFPRLSDVTLAAWLVGYGALIEVVQGLTGWRSAEWHDLLMDIVGVTAGLLLARGLPLRDGRR